MFVDTLLTILVYSIPVLARFVDRKCLEKVICYHSAANHEKRLPLKDLAHSLVRSWGASMQPDLLILKSRDQLARRGGEALKISSFMIILLKYKR